MPKQINVRLARLELMPCSTSRASVQDAQMDRTLLMVQDTAQVLVFLLLLAAVEGIESVLCFLVSMCLPICQNSNG